MGTAFRVQVVRRGIITLPKKLREQSHIHEGDLLNLIDLGDGIVVMSPHPARVDQLSNQLAMEWRDSEQDLESMLATLREVRAEYGAKKR